MSNGDLDCWETRFGVYLGISCRYSDLGDSQNSERLLVDEWDKVFDSTLTCRESKSAAEILDPLFCSFRDEISNCEVDFEGDVRMNLGK